MSVWRSKRTSVSSLTKTANGALCLLYYSAPEGPSGASGETHRTPEGGVHAFLPGKLAETRRSRCGPGGNPKDPGELALRAQGAAVPEDRTAGVLSPGLAKSLVGSAGIQTDER